MRRPSTYLFPTAITNAIRAESGFLLFAHLQATTVKKKGLYDQDEDMFSNSEMSPSAPEEKSETRDGISN
jgi:hypothetical protein